MTKQLLLQDRFIKSCVKAIIHGLYYQKNTLECLSQFKILENILSLTLSNKQAEKTSRNRDNNMKNTKLTKDMKHNIAYAMYNVYRSKKNIGW